MTTMTDNWREVQTVARETLGDEIAALIDKARNEPHSESRLIGVLHKVQETFGFLGKEQLDAVAQLLQVPAAKVSGVASFYHFFRLTPRGKYVIHVCMGTACYVKGADRVAQKFMEELGISWGETSSDRLFTLEGSRCLGTCGLAPVVMIGDDVHGNVTADQVPIILDTYLKRAKEEG